MTMVFTKTKMGMVAMMGVLCVSGIAVTANAAGNSSRAAIVGASSSLNNSAGHTQHSVNPSHHYKRGVVHFNAKEYDKAYKSFNRVLKTRPQDANANFYMARIHVMRGQPDRAIPHYKRSIAFYGDVPSLLAGLGMVYAETNQRDKAKEIMVKLETASTACDNVCETAPRIAASLHVVAVALYPAANSQKEAVAER